MGQVSIVNPGGDGTLIGGGIVGNFNSLAIGTLQISGIETQGQMLEANVELTDANGLGEFTYRWYRDNNEIIGSSNNTYILSQDDVNTQLSFSVEYTDGAGFFEKYYSIQTKKIENIDDTTQGDILLSGLLEVGEEVSTHTGFISDLDGVKRFEYKWESLDTVDGVATFLSSEQKYSLSQNDFGKLIRQTTTIFDNYGVITTKTAMSNLRVIGASHSEEIIKGLHLKLSEPFTDSNIELLDVSLSDVVLKFYTQTHVTQSSNPNSVVTSTPIGLKVENTEIAILAENSLSDFLRFSNISFNNGLILDAIVVDFGKFIRPTISAAYLTDLIIIPLSSNQKIDFSDFIETESVFDEIKANSNTALTVSNIGSSHLYAGGEQINFYRLMEQAKFYNSNFYKSIGTSQQDELLAIDIASHIYGLGGSDTLIGGLGDDILVGGLDADTITTGGGNDLVVYEASGDVGDTITDFSASDDKISIAQLMNSNASSIAYADVIGLTAIGSDTIVKMDPTGSGSFTVTVATLKNILPNALGASNFDIDGSALSQTLSGSVSSSRKSAEFDGDPAHYPAAEVFAVSTDSSSDLFLRATSINDETIFEVVAKPSASIQSFDFTLIGSGGVNLSDFVVDTDIVADLGSSGTLTETSNTELTFTLTAASGSLAGATEHVLATFTATGQGTLTVSQSDLGASSIPTLTYNISKDTVDASGAYEMSFGNGDAVQLQAHADYVVPSTNPITPSDALEVLKTVVRINQSPTAEQLIAGDTDKDGKLTPSDALAILKKVVRMDGGVEPEWIFIDGAADYTSMGFTSVKYDDIIDIAAITSSTTLNFEGILLGDFDGTL